MREQQTCMDKLNYARYLRGVDTPLNVLIHFAVLAHAAYCRKDVQNEMLDLGGIPLVLSQCQVSILPIPFFPSDTTL